MSIEVEMILLCSSFESVDCCGDEMTQLISVKRWMKMPEISARGLLFHFIWSKNDEGVYITTCGKANRNDFEELTLDDEDLIQKKPELCCYFCFCSPRYYQAMKEKENDSTPT